MFTGELKINDVRGSFTIDPRSVLYGPTLRLTVWKFENFSVIQILREINFGQLMVKMVFFYVCHLEKLISREIRIKEKFSNFHTVRHIPLFYPILMGQNALCLAGKSNYVYPIRIIVILSGCHVQCTTRGPQFIFPILFWDVRL